MKINDFHEIRDFRSEAHLRHSCRVVQSAENSFFQKTHFFFVRNKNMTRIVSDIGAGVGALRSSSKPSKSMIFRKFDQMYTYCTVHYLKSYMISYILLTAEFKGLLLTAEFKGLYTPDRRV